MADPVVMTQATFEVAIQQAHAAGFEAAQRAMAEVREPGTAKWCAKCGEGVIPGLCRRKDLAPPLDAHRQALAEEARSAAITRAMNAALAYRNIDSEAVDEQDAWVDWIDAIDRLAALAPSARADSDEWRDLAYQRGYEAGQRAAEQPKGDA